MLANSNHTVAEKQPFSESTLWELQQNYFAQQGVNAWRTGQVPHYVSNNPRLANSYAEMVIALWRDQQRLGFTQENSPEPIYLIELGAGFGRFAFHFLQRLTQLCHQADIPLDGFCYILTDVAEQNLAFLSQHPRFQPFFANGLSDVALFDINQSTQLHLQHRDYILTTDSCANPVVIIANYLFDSIPQELFFINEGQISQCRVSLHTDTDPAKLDKMELLGHVRCAYEYQPLEELPYGEEPHLQQLLTEYQRTLSNTHLLFPLAGLRCLHRLQALSKAGFVLLTADKGTHHLDHLKNRPAPQLIAHTGCFSLNVNFHALKRFCEQGDGIALFPPYSHNHVNIGCLLLLEEAERYKQTKGAYARHVAEFGPDAFYSITKHARKDMAAMSVRDILAYLQLSFYDAHLLTCYLPRLLKLVPEFTDPERKTMQAIIDHTWQNYFPIGEPQDLAQGLATLLFAMEDFEGALGYLDHSVNLYGRQADTLFNMALCCLRLGKDDAKTLLKEVLEIEPSHQRTVQLLQKQQTLNEEKALPQQFDGIITTKPNQPEETVLWLSVLKPKKPRSNGELVFREGAYK